MVSVVGVDYVLGPGYDAFTLAARGFVVLAEAVAIVAGLHDSLVIRTLSAARPRGVIRMTPFSATSSFVSMH